MRGDLEVEYLCRNGQYWGFFYDYESGELVILHGHKDASMKFKLQRNTNKPRDTLLEWVGGRVLSMSGIKEIDDLNEIREFASEVLLKL